MTGGRTCLGCERTVEAHHFLIIGERPFAVCEDCQDQLGKNEMALVAALREVLVAAR